MKPLQSWNWQLNSGGSAPARGFRGGVHGLGLGFGLMGFRLHQLHVGEPKMLWRSAWSEGIPLKNRTRNSRQTVLTRSLSLSLSLSLGLSLSLPRSLPRSLSLSITLSPHRHTYMFPSPTALNHENYVKSTMGQTDPKPQGLTLIPKLPKPETPMAFRAFGLWRQDPSACNLPRRFIVVPFFLLNQLYTKDPTVYRVTPKRNYNGDYG